MAKKQVSVRLSATGGDQVRREFKGVGEDGEKAFRKTSREVERANAKLAGFARRTKLVAAAAGTAVAAAGVAMVRNALQSVDAQAKLAQSLNTTVGSVQILERAGDLAGVAMSGVEQATKDLTRRLSQATSETGPAVDALDRLGLSATELLALPLDARVAAINSAVEKFIPAAERAAVAGQLFGEEGSIAMGRIDTATLKQATQDMKDFGAIVSDQDADQIERTNDALTRLGLIGRGLANQLAVAVAPALERIADAMAATTQVTGPMGRAIKGLIGNIDRLLTYTGTFAALMAGKWVAGMAAAAVATIKTAGALRILRGALIRTGIGALIVGAGELVYWFGRLVSGAGGFGAALGLLKDLAVQVFDKLKAKAAAWSWDMLAEWRGFKTDALWAFLDILDGATTLANILVNTMQGAVESLGVIWRSIPAVLGNAIYSASGAVLGGIEKLLNGTIDRINAFFAKVNAKVAELPDWARSDWMTFDPIGLVDLPDNDNPYASATQELSAGIKAAFEEAFSETPFNPTNSGLIETILAAENGVKAARAIADRWRSIGDQPLTAWQALKDAVTGTSEEGEEALESSVAAADALTEALTSAGTAADTAKEKLTGWATIREGLKSYVDSIKDWGASISGIFTKAFSSAESAFRSFVTTGKIDFKSLVRSVLADLAVLSFRRAVLAPLANAVFGGLGGGSNLLASVAHSDGMVGQIPAKRSVPSAVFVRAPRLHSGGWAGLRPDEVPAILQRGERVLSRREAAVYGRGEAQPQAVTLNIDARGAQAGVAEQIADRLEAMMPAVRKLARDEVSSRLGRGYKL